MATPSTKFSIHQLMYSDTLAGSYTEITEFAESAEALKGINEIGTLEAALDNKTRVDAYSGVGPFSPGGTLELSDMGIVKWWVGEDGGPAFADTNLAFIGLYRSPQADSLRWANKFKIEVFDFTYLAKQDRLPCYLTGGRYEGEWTVRQIIVGRDGGLIGTTGVRTDGLLARVARDADFPVQANETWPLDGLGFAGVPVAANFAVMGTTLTSWRAARGSTLFQALSDLCELMGLTFKLGYNSTGGKINAVIRPRKTAADTPTTTLAESEVMRNAIKLSNADRLDAAKDAVEVEGDLGFNVFAYAGVDDNAAGLPRWKVPITDRSIKSDIVAQLRADQEFTRLTADIYEGSFEVDAMHRIITPRRWAIEPNDVVLLNDSENAYVDEPIVVGRVTLSFDPLAAGSPRLGVRMEADRGVFRNAMAQERGRYEQQRQIASLIDQGEPTSTSCPLRPKLATKKLTATGYIRKQADPQTSTNNYENAGSQVASW